MEYDRTLTATFKVQVTDKMNALIKTLPSKPNQALMTRVKNLISQSTTSQVCN